LPPVMATFEPCADPKFQSDVPSVLPLTGMPKTLPCNMNTANIGMSHRMASMANRAWTDAPSSYGPMAHGTTTLKVIMAAPIARPPASLPAGLAPLRPTDEKARPSFSRSHRASSNTIIPKPGMF